MTQLIQFYGGRSNFGATSPEGQIFIWNSPSTILLTCTLANEYTSSNEISKKNSTVRGDCIACDALLKLKCLINGMILILIL